MRIPHLKNRSIRVLCKLKRLGYEFVVEGRGSGKKGSELEGSAEPSHEWAL